MFTVKIKIYDRIKYDHERTEIAKMSYCIKGFKLILGGSAAAKIEAETDGNSIDDLHEYLVLEFENGETSTFRYSYVDMFERG